MATNKDENKSSGSAKANRAREEAGLILPEFGSLPATAGLTNAQAFQLSIRHALSLLPSRFATGLEDQLPERNPERFRLL